MRITQIQSSRSRRDTDDIYSMICANRLPLWCPKLLLCSSRLCPPFHIHVNLTIHPFAQLINFWSLHARKLKLNIQCQIRQRDILFGLQRDIKVKLSEPKTEVGDALRVVSIENWLLLEGRILVVTVLVWLFNSKIRKGLSSINGERVLFFILAKVAMVINRRYCNVKLTNIAEVLFPKNCQWSRTQESNKPMLLIGGILDRYK